MSIRAKAVLPFGFKANGVSCGIKKSGKPDLALIYSEMPAQAAGCFTANTLEAAPVLLCRRRLSSGGKIRAIVANSGNANCFTGAGGLADAVKTAGYTAGLLDVKPWEVLVASTGIIGKPLPLERIVAGLPRLVSGLSSSGINKAQQAILTTDTFAKSVSTQVMIGSKKVRLCGIAKGAGMIAPDMATMLCFIVTDAAIMRQALGKALKEAVNSSFNRITIDGCMSTNDSVIVMANAAAKNPLIGAGADFRRFSAALAQVCLELARMIVRDAEGATKFIAITVNQAASVSEAKRAALAVANSNLFKTAMFGQDPNFGRIVAAVGSCGIPVKEKDFKVRVSPLHKKDITVGVWLGRGKDSVTVYTSDLTPAYIKINAAYN
ncbi:MAG: bifunctional glutamate N-acetyltransferase/amino-acid acetyltransferase ArgJ [Candidatus Omnitrophica bacterium]|nr:bifunctional glutamate N-acetyltransferase/amino-acid acetyltransferase ArgJ [Candidatus Omnitrophota bacterium]